MEGSDDQGMMDIDALPSFVKNSMILTNHHRNQLAELKELPVSDSLIDPLTHLILLSLKPSDAKELIHKHAAFLLDNGKINEAWEVLLIETKLYSFDNN